MKFLAGISVVVIALCSLHWLDAFHITAALLALFVGAVACVWWKRRNEPVESEEVGSDPFEDLNSTLGDRIRGVGLGAFWGVLVTGLIAAVSAAMAATPIYPLFYGCDELLSRIETLKAGNAYAYALHLTEQRLRLRASGTCRARLSEQRVRLLVQLAERSSTGERQTFLTQAVKQAEELRNSDLIGLIRSKLDVVDKQTQIEQLQKSQLVVQDLGNALELDFPDVLFEPGHAALAPPAVEIAREIAVVVRKNPGKQIRIEGHTDNTGSPDFNERLSQERAESVRRALVAEGLGPDLIAAQGFGSSRPIASNDTPEGRGKNRRVEVLIPK